MSFKIRNLVIYNSKGDKRILSFNETGVTIISGSSGTGKTSISDIISYCLGGDFDVKGKIRNVIEWYALSLKIGNKDIFVARKTPPDGQSATNVCFFRVGNNTIPEFAELQGNDSIESVTNYISKEIGISANLITPKIGSTLSPAEPSLKHSLYYNFLKQSTIANERVLFHRQEEAFVANYIKLTAPYFIGAIPEDQIEKKILLAEHKRKLKQVTTELNEQESMRGKGTAKGYSLLKEAEALDLVDVKTPPSNSDELLSMLQDISFEKSEGVEKLPVDALGKLYNLRAELTESYTTIRNELDIANKFLQEQGSYSHESKEQQGRLLSINLFKTFSSDNHECPSCGTHGIDFSKISNEITKSFSILDKQIELVSNTRTKLGIHIEELSIEASKIKEKLQHVNMDIYSINKQNTDLMNLRQVENQKAKVIGRISLYLESFDTQKDLSNLHLLKEELQTLVNALESEINFSTVEEVIESQLSLIGKDMTAWSTDLKMEYSGFDHRLSLSKLTVEALTDRGPVSMSKMGSGQNWLGCHLITYFSLQKWFIAKNRPVPRFLFLDQPSQVWFPADTSEKAKLSDEDWAAVKRLYAWIFKVSDVIKDLQVILVDHVDFQDDPLFVHSLKERWRGGEALVPKSWLK